MTMDRDQINVYEIRYFNKVLEIGTEYRYELNDIASFSVSHQWLVMKDNQKIYVEPFLDKGPLLRVHNLDED